MKFSTQLVLSTLSITALSITVFGSVAYWIIDNNLNHKQHEVLEHTVNTVQKYWNNSDTNTLDQSLLNKMHEKFSAPDTIFLVESTDGGLFLAGDTNQTAIELATKLISAFEKPDATKDHGSLALNDKNYHWLISHLPNSPYSITLLKLNPSSHQQIRTKLGMRLFTTSLIIIWLSVWLSLFLGSMISKRLKEKNDELKHQALHDSLTGLGNRNQLFNYLHQAQLESNRTKKPFALLLLDIDNFKEINDALGHHFGDQMLKKISRIIQRILRKNDLLARLGGDEFAILLPGTGNKKAIECAKNILASLKTSFNVRDIRIESSASIGIAFYPQDGSDAEILLQRADIAMYQAKQTRSNYVIYDQSKDSNNVRQLTLMNDLRYAIKNSRLDVHYQPLINQKTEHTVAAEALVRWNHPELGNISPEEFIPIAERTGIVRKLTFAVAKQAMLDCKKWRDMGYDMKVAINISTHCLQDLSFPKKLNQILQAIGVPAYNIELEITETALMQDVSRARLVLQELNQAGFSLSIDDFGTGFSSLAYLKDLPVDTLKIDKSFIFDMDNNEDNMAIVQTIIELAHNFNCRVIAEGVETKRSLEQLESLGNDIVQGFYFSRPLPFKELSQWLKKSEWNPASTVKKNELKIV